MLMHVDSYILAYCGSLIRELYVKMFLTSSQITSLMYITTYITIIPLYHKSYTAISIKIVPEESRIRARKASGKR